MRTKPIALIVMLLLLASALPVISASAQDGETKNESQDVPAEGIHSNASCFSGKHLSFAIDGSAIRNFTLVTRTGEMFGAISSILFPDNLSVVGEGCKAVLSCGCISIEIFDSVYGANFVMRNNGTSENIAIEFLNGSLISSCGAGFIVERPHDNWDADITIAPFGNATISEEEGKLAVILPNGSRLSMRFSIEELANNVRIETNRFIDSALLEGKLGAEINVAKVAEIEEYSVKYRDIVLEEKTKTEGKAVILIDSPNEEKGCVVVVNLDKSIVNGDHLETIRVRSNVADTEKSVNISTISSAAQQIDGPGIGKCLYYLENFEYGIRLIMIVPHFSLLELEIVDLDIVFPGWEQQSDNFDDFLDDVMNSLSGYTREDIDLNTLMNIKSIDFDIWNIVTSGGSISINIEADLESNISVLKMDADLKDVIMESAPSIPLDIGTLTQLISREYLTADEIRTMMTGPLEQAMENWMRNNIDEVVRKSYSNAEILFFELKNLEPKYFSGDPVEDPINMKIIIGLRFEYPLTLASLLKKSDIMPDPEITRLKSGKGLLVMLSYPNYVTLNASSGWKFALKIHVPEQYRFVYSNENPSYGSLDSSQVGWEMDAKDSAQPLSGNYIVGISSMDLFWTVISAIALVAAAVFIIVTLAVFLVRKYLRKRNVPNS